MDLRASAEAELVDVQQNVIEKETQFRPWFLLRETFETVTVPVSAGYLDLPATFLAAYEEGFMYAVLPNGNRANKPMKRVTYEEGLVHARDEDGEPLESDGIPTKYTIIGGRFQVWPIMVADVDVKIRYYETQAVINAATPETHPILAYASDWLLNEAGSRVAEAAQQTEALQLFQSRAIIARKRVEAETIERGTMDMISYAGGDL
jgi:hypothetical protein